MGPPKNVDAERSSGFVETKNEDPDELASERLKSKDSSAREDVS